MCILMYIYVYVHTYIYMQVWCEPEHERTFFAEVLSHEPYIILSPKPLTLHHTSKKATLLEEYEAEVAVTSHRGQHMQRVSCLGPKPLKGAPAFNETDSRLL